MKKFATWITSGLGMVGLIVFSSGASWSQDIFPAEPSRDTLFLVCAQCHSLNRITTAKLTAEEWEFTLYDMISRGAPVREREIDALKKYLIDNFSSDKK